MASVLRNWVLLKTANPMRSLFSKWFTYFEFNMRCVKSPSSLNTFVSNVACLMSRYVAITEVYTEFLNLFQGSS